MTKPARDVDYPKPPALLLDRNDAAGYLGVSPGTFDEVVRPHVPYVAVGSQHRWSVDALRAWATEHEQSALAGTRRKL